MSPEILTQLNQKVTLYTINVDGFATYAALEDRILSASIAPCAQYPDGLKLTFKPQKCRKSQIIRPYRGWSSKHDSPSWQS